MEERVFSKVVSEISEFFHTITTPFLNRMADDEREKAITWSTKVMEMKNYDAMVKYLTFLTFMIISGHLVAPFDGDPYVSQIPALPVYIGATTMLNYVENVAEQCKINDHVVNDELMQSVKPLSTAMVTNTSILSNDEYAYLSTQPTPGVGIRLYMAISEQPFGMWSKNEGIPQAVKKEIPAREVIDRGLSLAKEKLYSYLDELEKMRNQKSAEQTCSKCQKKIVNGTNQLQSETEPIVIRTTQEPIPGTSGVTFRPTKIPSNASITSTPSQSSEPTRKIRYKAPPKEPFSEEEKKLEVEVESKAQRWFSNPEYEPYFEEIKNFIRGGARIDSIRRGVHHIMRKSYKNPMRIPLFMQDSLDDSFSITNRIHHLRMRYIDVLQKEYGITNEGDLYYLAGLVGVSEDQMIKARKIISNAEEGMIDLSLKEKFQKPQRSTCGKLMNLTDELLESSLESIDSSQSSIQTPSTSDSRPGQIPRFTRSTPVRKLTRMPPTSTLDRQSVDDTDDSNTSYVENEPEPEFFDNMDGIENNSQSDLNDSLDTRRQQPSHYFDIPNNSEESNSEPTGKVHPQCPRESC